MPQHDEHADLLHARTTAREAHRAAGRLLDFAEHMSVVVDPSEMAEYDTLIAHEAAAISDRVEAFGRLGFSAPSIDATGDPES